MLLYPIGTTAACVHACAILHKQGSLFTDHPCPEITHIILDTPAFQPDGQLRGGGYIETILSMLPNNICVIGGNLNVPALKDYTKWDLLQDPLYLAKNAEITADCALRLSAEKLRRTFSDAPALVIGWGRIGKCLARKLQAVGCPVTVAARKEQDQAMILALGFNSLPIAELPRHIQKYHLIFNTVPAPLFLDAMPEDSIALELASKPGLPEMHTVCAKGLPGVMAPYSSGKLIAHTIMKFFQEEIP